jgi:hypothetical protein
MRVQVDFDSRFLHGVSGHGGRGSRVADDTRAARRFAGLGIALPTKQSGGASAGIVS